jgi:hypothetical protein
MSKNSPVETALQKKKMIDALEANFGSVTKAAKVAGITPRTHYRWVQEDREYGYQSESIKDICYKKIKDKLLETALKQIEKGDSTVLNKLLSIYFKHVPFEIQKVNMYNNVPIRATVKWVDTPQDPRREGYVKPEE